ncbi:hypothetical protein EDB84DRAFT_1453454 [Lactarius hengduanensis]|nr:hypothetical protein EDB84DRAFT_1453454 [Lactarius hengduanensis]
MTRLRRFGPIARHLLLSFSVTIFSSLVLGYPRGSGGGTPSKENDDSGHVMQVGTSDMPRLETDVKRRHGFFQFEKSPLGEIAPSRNMSSFNTRRFGVGSEDARRIM